ncbi:MAG: UbiA family prenyltransferase [Planctomycetota bacterium]|nr:UbiA family prenyltransferase [Planctomycetota bacterium]
MNSSDNDYRRHGPAAWTQLLRVPNLLTVPGDPLAGFVLGCLAVGGASLSRAVAPAATGLLLYCAGLIQNDLADLAEDRRNRPGRPLASGQIRPLAAVAALLACVILAAAAAISAGTASLLVAAVLLAAISAYNFITKRIAVIGPLNMGLCRGMSLMLGASALGWDALAGPAVWIPACLLAFYVAGVTAIAAGETQRRSLRVLRWLPAVTMLTWASVLLVILAFRAPSVVCLILAAGWTASRSRSLAGRPEPEKVQRTVGELLRGLLLVQAAIVVIVPWTGWFLGGFLLMCWPANALLARKFHAS